MFKQDKGKGKKDKIPSLKAAQAEQAFISSKEGRIRDIRDGAEVKAPNCQPAAYYNQDNLQIGTPDGTSSGVYTLQPAYLTMHSSTSGFTNTDDTRPHTINQDFVNLPNVNMIIFEILIKVYDFVHDNIKSTTRIESVDYEIFSGFSSKKGGGPTFTETTTMKEDFSFILTEIISYAGPVLIEEIREIYYQVYKKESDLFSENEILLISFIFVINKLFTLYTGYYNNYALTTFFPTKIFTNENEEIIIEGLDQVSIKDVYKNIKLIKLSFIQTLIEAFYSSTKYNFNFDNETQNIFVLFSNNFDLFFDRYLEHLVENTALLEQKEPLMPIIKVEEKETNLSPIVSESTPILSSSQSVPMLSSQSQSYSPDKKLYGGAKRGDFLQTFIDNCGVSRGHIPVTPYLNNQILRVIVCQLLTSLSILSKVRGAADISNNDEPSNYPSMSTNVPKSSKNTVLSDIHNYTLTEFGKHLKTKNPNTNISNFHETKAQTMPTNQSQRHPTKALIENILDQLEPIWKSDITKAHSFSSFADYEHGLEYHFYDMAFNNSMFFQMPVIPKLSEEDKKKCCPYRFIIDNASTVLNAQGTFSVAHPNPALADNKLDSFASILDPAGSTNIKIDDGQEYGNIHCIVLGNKLEMGGIIPADMNVIFRGNIDLVPNFEIKYLDKRRPSETKPCLRNSSINTISHITGEQNLSINVECNLIIAFNDPLLLSGMEEEFNKSIKKDSTQKVKAIEQDSMINHPNSTTLEDTRKFNIQTLMQVIKESFNPKNPLLDPYYTDIKYVNDLISGTLMKTLGDLMQVLLALIKFGGINDLWSFGKDVIPYDRGGNALRVVSHHDLTASVITYFLLIFGNYLFIPQANTIWQMTVPLQGNLDNYINHGKNMGAAMNDHTLTRFAVGNINDINQVMTLFNGTLYELEQGGEGEKYNCENLKGFNVVSVGQTEELRTEIQRIKSAMDRIKEDLNEKKRIIVALENLNNQITYELKESIIKGNASQAKYIFLEKLITAISAIATEPLFLEIFNCKYYNILPSLLSDRKIVTEICSIIQQILDNIKDREIDLSAIDINLRFDQIESIMGIDLSQTQNLSYLESKGVKSIIEIVSSVVNDGKLRTVIANYLFLIDKNDTLKRVCEQFYPKVLEFLNSENFMLFVISIINFFIYEEDEFYRISTKEESQEYLYKLRANFFDHLTTHSYGLEQNIVFNFIVDYLCDYLCTYSIHSLNFSTDELLHDSILKALQQNIQLLLMYRIFNESYRKNNMFPCLRKCRKEYDETSSENYLLSLASPPQELNEITPLDLRKRDIEPEQLSWQIPEYLHSRKDSPRKIVSQGSQSQNQSENRYSLQKAREIYNANNSNFDEFSNALDLAYPEQSAEMFYAFQKQVYDITGINADDWRSLKRQLFKYFQDTTLGGGRPSTRGRKQKMKRFTKGRNRKLRKGKGTRKTYRKKNKTRRR